VVLSVITSVFILSICFCLPEKMKTHFKAKNKTKTKSKDSSKVTTYYPIILYKHKRIKATANERLSVNNNLYLGLLLNMEHV